MVTGQFSNGDGGNCHRALTAPGTRVCRQSLGQPWEAWGFPPHHGTKMPQGMFKIAPEIVR